MMQRTAVQTKKIDKKLHIKTKHGKEKADEIKVKMSTHEHVLGNQTPNC